MKPLDCNSIQKIKSVSCSYLAQSLFFFFSFLFFFCFILSSAYAQDNAKNRQQEQKASIQELLQGSWTLETSDILKEGKALGFFERQLLVRTVGEIQFSEDSVSVTTTAGIWDSMASYEIVNYNKSEIDVFNGKDSSGNRYINNFYGKYRILSEKNPIRIQFVFSTSEDTRPRSFDRNEIINSGHTLFTLTKRPN